MTPTYIPGMSPHSVVMCSPRNCGVHLATLCRIFASVCLRQLDLRLAFLGPPPTGFRTEVVVGPQHSAHPVLERHVVCSSRGSLQLAGSTFQAWLATRGRFVLKPHSLSVRNADRLPPVPVGTTAFPFCKWKMLPAE